MALGSALAKAKGKGFTTIKDNFNNIRDSWNSVFITSDRYGIDGLQFDIRQEEILKLSSTITDYVAETNSSIQNMITLNPIVITLTGLIGENVVRAPKITKATDKLQDKLNNMSLFTPELSSTAQKFLNGYNDTVEKMDKAVEKVGGTIGFLNNLGNDGESKQWEFSKKIVTLWKNRELLTIKSDLFTLPNMVIQEVELLQTEETTGKSKATITFKQITFGDIKVEKKKAKKLTNQLQNARKGKTVGLKSKIVEGLENYGVNLGGKE